MALAVASKVGRKEFRLKVGSCKVLARISFRSSLDEVRVRLVGCAGLKVSVNRHVQSSEKFSCLVGDVIEISCPDDDTSLSLTVTRTDEGVKLRR